MKPQNLTYLRRHHGCWCRILRHRLQKEEEGLWGALTLRSGAALRRAQCPLASQGIAAPWEASQPGVWAVFPGLGLLERELCGAA